MVVSKVAVIALVLIVACPILLGYGMNLQETTHTGYKTSGDSINITNQLYNGNGGASYTYAHGDINTMNTNFDTYSDYTKMPQYENIITQNGTYPVFQDLLDNVSFGGLDDPDANFDLSYYGFYYIECETTMNMHMWKTIGGIGGTESYIGWFNNIQSLYVYHYNNDAGSYYTYTTPSGDKTTVHVTSNAYLSKIAIGGVTNDNLYRSYRYVPNYLDNDNYVDISAGFHFWNTSNSNSDNSLWANVKLPDSTKQFTFTMDLNSISDANYALHIDMAPSPIYQSTTPFTNLPMQLMKTTIGSDVTWTLTNECDSTAPVTELYTDPELSSNTYQFTISADSIYDESTSKYYLVIHVKAAYVGEWPTYIGVANPYIVYDLDYVIRDYPSLIYNSPLTSDDLIYYKIRFKADNAARTPTMRIDDALFRAFEYQTITDRTFLPSAYKSNPGVTMNNIKMFGTSITFGGVTYAVNNGRIIVNNQSLKLEGLAFNTELNGSGTYDNKIGGVTVSTTASDPGMTFGGSWVASVTVQSMETYTYTATDWIPGKFAWDGMDTNFLLVGLFTSIGAFIGLGIYIRKTGSSLWPLLIVCGGAAALFFILL